MRAFPGAVRCGRQGRAVSGSVSSFAAGMVPQGPPASGSFAMRFGRQGVVCSGSVWCFRQARCGSLRQRSGTVRRGSTRQAWRVSLTSSAARLGMVWCGSFGPESCDEVRWNTSFFPRRRRLGMTRPHSRATHGCEASDRGRESWHSFPRYRRSLLSKVESDGAVCS